MSMKNIKFLVLTVIISSITLASCKSDDKNKEELDYIGEKSIVTEKIMYDVTIVNEVIPDRSKDCPDWFWENLPTPDGDNFIKQLIEDAVSGKLKTYYFDPFGDYESFEEIKAEDREKFMEETMTFELEVPDSTDYEYSSRFVDLSLDYTYVKKLRFLEEWFIADGKFHKKVIAVAPYFSIEYEDVEPINTAFFWIMINDK